MIIECVDFDRNAQVGTPLEEGSSRAEETSNAGVTRLVSGPDATGSGGLSCLGNTLRGAVSKPIGSADSVCYDPESKMASPRSKSPHPVTPRKDEKEESFWDKIGTIGRKKKIKEGT